MSNIRPGKVYGDEASLKRLGKPGTKQANGELVPTITNPVGRPAGPAYRGAPQGPAATAEERSPYEEQYHKFGRAARNAQVAQNLLRDQLAGPWVREYAAHAIREAKARGREVRDTTPFVEE